MKAVGYIRVSTDRLEQKDSLENQKSIFLDCIKERGFDFYDFYIDVFTGTTDKRESFNRLMEDAKQNKFDVIIVKELSRLARNAELAYGIKNLLENHDIKLISLEGAIDTTVDSNKNQMFGIYAWLYQQESENTSNRTKAVFISKYKNGEYLSAQPPYGYEKLREEKKLVIRKDETPDIVREIFNKFLDDWGYDKIARWLSNEGYKTPAQIVGKKNAGEFWHGPTVKKILTNPAYIGDLVQHREETRSAINKKRKQIPKEEQIVVKGTHEAIIDETTFNRVQEIISKREANGRGKTKSKTNLFTNFVFCADCGTGLWYKKNTKSYTCGKHTRHGIIACTQHKVLELDLIDLIIDDLKGFTQNLDKEKLKKMALNKAEQFSKNSKKKLKEIENQISKINAEKENLLTFLLDGTISKEVYTKRIEDNEKKMKELDLKKSDLTSNNKVFEIDDKVMKLIEDVIKIEELNRDILSKLVDKILVKEDGELEIFYKFSLPQKTHIKQTA
ncbi:hypothetical protein SDC9_48157 [bioreactor metagenome]|uniref:Uncharacterized protein n=1 Tax=bioreactor metagenome TaxID=1076179 RepID=A0A644WEF5_9ZZZZ